MSLLVTHDQAVRHESGHAAYWATKGVPVTSVDVLDVGHRQGFTIPAGHTSAFDQALSIMCAWLCEGSLPDWPPDSGAITSTDEKRFKAIAEEHWWTEDDYVALIRRARALMATPAFQREYKAISSALKTTPRLDARDLARLLAPARQHKTVRRQPGPEFPLYDHERRRAIQRVDQLEAESLEADRRRAWQRLLDRAGAQWDEERERSRRFTRVLNDFLAATS